MEASFLRWEQFDEVSFPISWVLLLKQNNHKNPQFSIISQSHGLFLTSYRPAHEQQNSVGS